MRMITLITAATIARSLPPQIHAAIGTAIVATMAAREEMRVRPAIGEPNQCEHSGQLPREREQDAEIRRDAFSALEAKPDRKDVSEKRGEACQHRWCFAQKVSGNEHGDGAFGGIKEQRRSGETLVAGP